MDVQTITIHGRPVAVTSTEVIYTAGMAIDFDGCPNAYAPIGFGSPLDALANAGKPGRWWGIVTDTGNPDGEPLVQIPGDPFPGYYIATSALNDPAFSRIDPRRYVDGRTVPMMSIPIELLHQGVRVGDLALVTRLGKGCFAIVGDDGGAGLGEGSPALADALGVPSGRHGGCGSGVTYRIRLGTRANPAWPRDVAADAVGIFGALPG
jgi:hypothetical protein